MAAELLAGGPVAEAVLAQKPPLGVPDDQIDIGVAVADGRDPQDYQPNDEVTIRVPDGALVGAALLVYLVPLLGLIGGMLFFDARFSEPAIGALLGFGAGLGLVWLHGRLQFVAKRYQPVLVGRPRRSASGVQTIHI